MTTKSWAGSTLADRQAERRAKLLEAGQTLLAEGGGPAVTVRAVCRTAGVTERYFYENFRDRDELVLTVFGGVAAEVFAAVEKAVAGHKGPQAIAAATVDAVVGLTIDEPTKGRVLFIAPMTEPLLYDQVDIIAAGLVSMIRDQLPPRAPAEHRELVASSLAGALAHLFHQYVAGSLVVSREAFVDHVVALLLTVAGMPVRK